MPETVADIQERAQATIQSLLSEQLPGIDVSTGTVVNELLVKPISVVVANQEAGLAVVRENMSLTQVLSSPDPDPALVDNLLSNFNVTRQTGAQASGVLHVYIDGTTNIHIAPSARFTCASVELAPVKAYVGVPGTITQADTPNINYAQAREVADGMYVFAVAVSSVLPITSVLAVGQPCTSDLNDPRVHKVEVGEAIVGGTVEETTVSLLERARTAMNARVVTGRDNIRALLLSQTGTTVLDSAVVGMGDVLQTRDHTISGLISTGGRVDVYVKTSAVPLSARILVTATRQSGNVWRATVPADRAYGTYGIVSVRYQDTLLDVTMTPILGYEPAPGMLPVIESAAAARYSTYQTLSIDFETTALPAASSSESVEIDVLYAPGIDDLQAYVNSAGVRSYSFDMLIRAAVPVVVEVSVELEYTTGVTAPELGVIQQKVADIINLKPMGSKALYTTDIAYACNLVFPMATVRTPVQLAGIIYRPDGLIALSRSAQALTIPELTGVSYVNAAFMCASFDVSVTLVEMAL